MNEADIPGWVYSVGGLLGATATAAGLAWKEKKKAKEPEAPAPDGSSVVEVKAAYFFDKKLIEMLAAEISKLALVVVEMNTLLKNEAQSRHDAKIAADAVERALRDERAKRGQYP